MKSTPEETQTENTISTANWMAVWSLTIGVAALIIAEFLPVGVLTPMAHDLGISEGVAGRAVTATSVFAVLSSVLTAYLTRNWNRKTVLLVFSFFLTISSVVVSIAPNFLLLLFGRVLLGIAIGGFWSMAAAIAIRLVPSDVAPKAIATIFGGSSFATVLAAPMGSFFGNILGWRNVFLIAALVGLAALIWQWISLPQLKPIGNTKLRTFIDVFKSKNFTTAMLAVALVFCGRFASFTYLRPFLEKTTGLGVNTISVALLVFGASYFVGNAFAPGMIKKNLRLALSAPAAILAVVAMGLLLFGTSPLVTFVLIFIWGAVFGPVAPSWSTWVARSTPDFAESAGGIFIAAIQGAAAVGSFAGGVIFDSFGSQGVFSLSAIAWFLSAAIVYFKISAPPVFGNQSSISIAEEKFLGQE